MFVRDRATIWNSLHLLLELKCGVIYFIKYEYGHFLGNPPGIVAGKGGRAAERAPATVGGVGRQLRAHQDTRGAGGGCETHDGHVSLDTIFPAIFLCHQSVFRLQEDDEKVVHPVVRHQPRPDLRLQDPLQQPPGAHGHAQDGQPGHTEGWQAQRLVSALY